MLRFTHKIRILSVADFRAVHHELSHRHRMRRRFLKWTISAAHHEISTLDRNQVGFDLLRRLKVEVRSNAGSREHERHQGYADENYWESFPPGRKIHNQRLPRSN